MKMKLQNSRGDPLAVRSLQDGAGVREHFCFLHQIRVRGKTLYLVVQLWTPSPPPTTSHSLGESWSLQGGGPLGSGGSRQFLENGGEFKET